MTRDKLKQTITAELGETRCEAPVNRRVRAELEAMVAEGICTRVVEHGEVRYELVLDEERN